MRAMLIGAVIGAAITIAVFQLRGGAAISAENPVEGPARPLDAIARSREIQLLKARIAELEAAGSAGSASGGAVVREPDDQIGMSTDDGWWSRLPANPAWDDAREQKVLERLAKNVGVKLDAAQVECRTRCCRIALPDETYDESLDDITSSVGIGFEPPDGIGTSKHGDGYLVTACWSTRSLATPMPDRAAEREALLAKAHDALDRCAHGVSPIITLKVQLHVDDDGQIEKVESNAKQLGQKAATCAESALLQAASFGPAPMSTRVPITVPLGK